MKLERHLKIARLLHKLKLDINPNGLDTFNKIRSILDEDFHLGISDTQFEKLGHIYYSIKKENYVK